MWALWLAGGIVIGYLICCFTVQLIVRKLRKEEGDD